MCLSGTVVASGPLMQEVTGSNPFTVMINIWSPNFQWKHLRKTQMIPLTHDNMLDDFTPLRLLVFHLLVIRKNYYII